MSNVTFDNFICDETDCGCTFSVKTNIKASDWVERTICPVGPDFEGKCPACGSQRIAIDPAQYDD